MGNIYLGDKELITSMQDTDYLIIATKDGIRRIARSNAGVSGATYTPTVNSDGKLSWTNDKGLENPAPVNIKGPKGDTGETGTPGPAGQDGVSGADGKSAYQYAQEGGYTGTEEEFAALVGKQIQQNKEDISKLSEEIEQLQQSSGTGTGTGLSAEAIDKLEEVGNYLAYTTADGGSKWTELINILRGSSSGGSGETEVTLESISATYTGGDVLEGTALTDLVGITVTAHYSDDSTENVTDYSLSGTISVGSNTITVYYQGITTTFEVVGIENTSSGVYGASLAWKMPANYNEWSENGNWFWVSYSSNTAAIQVENGFSLEKVYSKPIDGSKYKYFRIPTANGKQYSVTSNVDFYGSDSPNALTESGHPITRCTRNMQFVIADIDSSLDSEGFTIVYPSEEYEYYYIQFATNNSLTSSYPDLVGVFDAGILDSPLAEATE